MATWMPEDTAADQMAALLAGSLRFVVFSALPTPAGAATDGTEAAARVPITMSAPAVTTGARIMQSLNTADLIVAGLLVPSSEVVGCALADATTGEIRLVNDSWRPARTDIAAGGDLLVLAGQVAVYGARVA